MGHPEHPCRRRQWPPSHHAVSRTVPGAGQELGYYGYAAAKLDTQQGPVVCHIVLARWCRRYISPIPSACDSLEYCDSSSVSGLEKIRTFMETAPPISEPKTFPRTFSIIVQGRDSNVKYPIPESAFLSTHTSRLLDCLGTASRISRYFLHTVPNPKRFLGISSPDLQTQTILYLISY